MITCPVAVALGKALNQPWKVSAGFRNRFECDQPEGRVPSREPGQPF